MTYEKIQELKRNHLNKSQVSRRLCIDYKTVAKYWDMPPDEFSTCKNRAQRRRRKADAHKDFIVGCLQQYPDMTASQVYDWIKERTGLKKLPFRKRSFRNYVAAIRKEYDIPRRDTIRQYEAVDDPPMGRQAQVDMGEISLETPSGRRKKVYGFGMVLSNSRQKYILWQTHPWTTADFVQAHIKAFAFFGGRPKEIVYDQDKVLAVSENHGDIIYTEGFQNYLKDAGKPFQTHLEKADLSKFQKESDGIFLCMTMEEFQHLGISTRRIPVLYIGSGFREQYHFSIRSKRELHANNGVLFQTGRNQVLQICETGRIAADLSDPAGDPSAV